MKIKAVYDNPRYVDRYTILTDQMHDRDKRYFYALGCSDHPDEPTGYSQWGGALPGRHLGKQITLVELPDSVRQHVRERLKN